MQIQESNPRKVIYTYLLHSPGLEDGVALPDSIHILKEHKVGQLMHSIVTYQTRFEQQLYTHMEVLQEGPAAWRFHGFLLMGGVSISELPQTLPLQIVGGRSVEAQSVDSSGTCVALAALPNEVEVANIQLKMGSGILCNEKLENNALFFFSDQQLFDPIEVELYDATKTLVATHRI